MDQNQSTKHFSSGHRLLLAVRDAGVSYSLRVQPEKIIILRYQDTPGRCGELKMDHIRGADQPAIRCGRYVNVAPTETSRDLSGDVLVKVKANGHRSGRFFQAFLA